MKDRFRRKNRDDRCSVEKLKKGGSKLIKATGEQESIKLKWLRRPKEKGIKKHLKEGSKEENKQTSKKKKKIKGRRSDKNGGYDQHLCRNGQTLCRRKTNLRKLRKIIKPPYWGREMGQEERKK